MNLRGRVERGKQLGRKLGFPTANIAPIEVVDLPKISGVYAAWILIEGECKKMPCVLNQGTHPTVPEGKPTIEAHIIDYLGELYGQLVEVEYVQFIRPEQKFDSVDALKAQIARDREEARRILCDR